MSIFESCTVPPIGEVSVCERNTEIQTEGTRRKSKVVTAQEYTRIVLLSDLLNSPQSLIRESTIRSAFLEQEHGLGEKVITSWSEKGVTGVLDQLLTVDELPYVLNKLLLYNKKFISLIQEQWKSLFEFKLAFDQSIDRYSRIPEWSKSPVKAFACHSLLNRVAVALQDDVVKVVCVKSNSQSTIKEKRQKQICCLAWRPLSACHIAVGCANGIFLWFLDASLQAPRPNPSQLQILSLTGHAPVTDISWSKHSYLLASVSPRDSSVVIWNIGSNSSVALSRLDRGNGFLSWSPCGQKLLTCSIANSFRVWDTITWKCEKWANLNGRCQVACWSHSGDILMFAVEGEACLYYVQYYDLSEENKIDIVGNGMAVKCCDLSSTIVDTSEGEKRIGGCIQTMAWDPSGSRLAVIFSGDSEHGVQRLVVLFNTQIKPLFEISLGGFIGGQSNEYPLTVAFATSFENGALLNVCWSSGVLSQIPLLFHVS